MYDLKDRGEKVREKKGKEQSETKVVSTNNIYNSEDQDIWAILNNAKQTSLSSLTAEVPVFKDTLTPGGFQQIEKITVPIPVSIISPDSHYAVGQLLSQLQQETLCNMEVVPRRILMPFNLGDNHWVGIIIDIYLEIEAPKKATGSSKILTKCQVAYIDSFPDANLTIQQIECRQQVKFDIAQIYKNLYQEFKFNSITLLTHNNSHDCGAYTCEHLIHAARYGIPALLSKQPPQINESSLENIKKSHRSILELDSKTRQVSRAMENSPTAYKNKRQYQGDGSQALMTFEKLRIEKILGLIVAIQDLKVKKKIQEAFVYKEKDITSYCNKLRKNLFEIMKEDLDPQDKKIYADIILLVFNIEISKVEEMPANLSKHNTFSISAKEAILIGMYVEFPNPIIVFNKDKISEENEIQEEAKPKHLELDLKRIESMIDILSNSSDSPRTILDNIGQIASTLAHRRHELFDDTANVPWILLEFLPSMLSKDCPAEYRDAVAGVILKNEKEALLLILKEVFKSQYQRYEKLFQQKPSKVNLSKEESDESLSIPQRLPTLERYVQHFYEKRNLIAARQLLDELSEKYDDPDGRFFAYPHKVDALQRALVVAGEALIAIDMNTLSEEQKAIATVIKPLRSDLLHVEREEIANKLRELFKPGNIAGERIIETISKSELKYLANMLKEIIDRLEHYEKAENSAEFLQNIPERKNVEASKIIVPSHSPNVKTVKLSSDDIRLLQNILLRYQLSVEVIIGNIILSLNAINTKVPVDKEEKKFFKQEKTELLGILRNNLRKIDSISELLKKSDSDGSVLGEKPVTFSIKFYQTDAAIIVDAGRHYDALMKITQVIDVKNKGACEKNIMSRAFEIAKQIDKDALRASKPKATKSEAVNKKERQLLAHQNFKIEKLKQWNNPCLTNIPSICQLARHLSESKHQFESDGNENLEVLVGQIAAQTHPIEDDKEKDIETNFNNSVDNGEEKELESGISSTSESQLNETTLFGSSVAVEELPYKYRTIDSALLIIAGLKDIKEQKAALSVQGDIEFRCAIEHKICLIAKFLDRFRIYAATILEKILVDKEELFRLRLDALIERRNDLAHRIYHDSAKECDIMINTLVIDMNLLLIEIKQEIFKLVRIERWTAESSQQCLSAKSWDTNETESLDNAPKKAETDIDEEQSSASEAILISRESQLLEQIGDNLTNHGCFLHK